MDWKITEQGFTLKTPFEARNWYNYLSNDDYGLKISHLADAYSTTLKSPRISVTHYDFFSPVKGRFVYIKDGKEIWSPSFNPCKVKLDKFSCTHSPGETSFLSEKNNIEVSQSIFLPQKGSFEIQLITLRNKGNSTKEVFICCQTEFLLYNSFNIDPTYYSWYTDTTYSEKAYTLRFSRKMGTPAHGFYKSLKEPNSFDSSMTEFMGNANSSAPEAVQNARLNNSFSGGDPYTGAFGFNLSLKPGEEYSNAIFLGQGDETLSLLEEKFTSLEAVIKERTRVREDWSKKLHRSELDVFEQGNFQNYLQTFFPYQIYQQSMGMVRSVYRGFRDVAQDAMGLVYYDPEKARRLILDLATRQFDTGRCLRQWNTEGGSNDIRDFRDLPFWLPITTAHYIKQTGDKSILKEEIPFLESEKTGSLKDHILKGWDYALHLTKDNLIEMGEGDWNDALSGLGKQGGSVWLNQIAFLAASKIQDIWNKDVDLNKTLEATKTRLYNGVKKQWTGSWFSRGITEEGQVIGGKERIFLLPQVWFTLSGMSKIDPNKAETALDSTLKRLGTDDGFLLCDPGFTEKDPSVGNLSALAPGLAENFAIYNHASAFAVNALFAAGRSEEGALYFHRCLPLQKDPLKTLSEPFVTVNFYNGGFYPSKRGRGGIPWLTSTISWLALALFEYVLPSAENLENLKKTSTSKK